MADFESPVLVEGSTETEVVTLADVSAVTKILVRSEVEQFGVSFGTSSGEIGDAIVCGSRPGEWLIIGDAQACAATAGSVEGGFTSVVDYTHNRALFRLGGTAAPLTLQKVCSIDWSDAMMPNGSVVSASVAKVGCDIIRNDTTEPQGSPPSAAHPSYLIACDRSFGQYLFDALLDATKEFTP